MNEGDSRLIQRWHLQIFLEEQFGEAGVKPNFDDNPDLIIEVDGKRIGVEHTQYFVKRDGNPGLAPIAQEAVQDKIIRKSWDFYKEHNATLLYLLVVFEDKTAFYGKDVDGIARKLANCVERLLGEGLQENTWYVIEAWREKRRGKPLPDGIRLLHLEIVPSPGVELWGPARGGAVPDLQISEIQTVIDGKNRRVPDYLLKCSEVWLLIVVDGSSPASHFGMDVASSGHQYSSAFSRVFLLHRFKHELYELPVKAVL